MYILAIFIALVCAATAIMLTFVIRSLDSIRSYMNTLECGISTLKNLIECIDHNSHTLIKGQEDHSRYFAEIETAKTKALSDTRKRIEADCRAIVDAIEDRYQMVYDQYEHLRGLLEKPVEGTGASRVKTLSEKEQQKVKNVQIAHALKQGGMSNREIAEEMGLAESTIRGYLKQVPGIISPDEEDHLGMPVIDDPAAYAKYVHSVIDSKLRSATDGKTVTACPFNDAHGECELACSNVCVDCIESARAFNLLD